MTVGRVPFGGGGEQKRAISRLFLSSIRIGEEDGQGDEKETKTAYGTEDI
jgi:hypothetical protein